MILEDIKKLVMLEDIKKLVDEQAEDEGLWFKAETATEQYLQDALRALHQIIEEAK